MLEFWNSGIMGDFVLLHFVQDKFTMLKEEKWDIGLLGVFFLTHKLQMFKNENLSFRINIPSFQHSIVPCMRQKHRASINPFNFRKLYNFRDAN